MKTFLRNYEKIHNSFWYYFPYYYNINCQIVYKAIRKNIFILEEEVKILEEKYDFLLLENDYLTTPERLIGLKEKIFKDKFFPINPKDIKNINTNE